eukprot:TRINITY_DN742_c0_g1_i5.p1 TRINITY_DN742_c0_g1~~TRINITY_DN742_c0_g1_i5.p1  ORF type:complete len:401 (+),score=103.05 TRINITY_DN742_c0_g1_i5:88-1290(+)
MIRRPPRSTLSSSSAASDVYKRQVSTQSTGTLLTGDMGCRVSSNRARVHAIRASEVLQLTMTAPCQCQLEPHALDTVLTVLKMSAAQLGLDTQYASQLQLLFSDEIIDHSSTLQQAGMHQEALFSVLGVEGIQGRQTALSADVLAAAKSGDADTLALVQEYCPERMELRDGNGMTALGTATFEGLTAATRLLLEHGADANNDQVNGCTPLYGAVFSGHTDTARLLIEHNADCDQATDYAWSPLYAAAYNGHASTVQLLLDSGGEVEVGGNTGWTPLYGAAHKGHTGVVNTLLKAGADVNQARCKGVTALYGAAYTNEIQVLKVLLANGAEVDKAQMYGRTPLYAAAWKGNHEAVQVLLAAGANPNRLPASGGSRREMVMIRHHTRMNREEIVQFEAVMAD